jgi:hypothetical protein
MFSMHVAIDVSRLILAIPFSGRSYPLIVAIPQLILIIYILIWHERFNCSRRLFWKVISAEFLRRLDRTDDYISDGLDVSNL